MFLRFTCNFVVVKDQSVPDPIRPRSNSNQFKSAKRPIGTRQRNSLSISNPLLASQLSKSAPVKTLPIEKMIWSRRDPRYLLFFLVLLDAIFMTIQ